MATNNIRPTGSRKPAKGKSADIVVKDSAATITIKNPVPPRPAKPALRDDDELDARHLLHVLTEIKNGNFDVRMPIDSLGLNGKICDTLNEIIMLNEKMTVDFTWAWPPSFPSVPTSSATRVTSDENEFS